MPLSGLTLGGSKASLQKEKSFQLAKAVDINTKKLRLPDACWPGQRRKRKEGCQPRIDAIVDSVLLEIAVGIIIAADLILTVLTFTVSENVAESTEVFVIGAIFLIVLLGDVMLRVAKFRLSFFYRPLNWLEFIVALAGCVMLVFEGVERAGCGGPCNNNRSATGGGTSLGRSIRPTIKAWRIVRTMMQLTNSRGGLHKQIDRQTDRFFGRLIRLYLNDFFIVAKQNVYMKPSQGMLHVEKAQVRSSVLKGLHLPLTISCGIIDLVHVKIDLSKGDKDAGGEESNHKVLVVIENALIVVGPGHHQEKPAPPWDFDNVLDGKRKLIDLLTRRLEAGAKHKVAAAAAPKGTKKGTSLRVGLVGKALKSRAKAHVEEILSRGVHLSIQNLEIRYEDPLAELAGQSGYSVVGGIRMGYLTVRAAGAAEDDELDEQEDFRAKGRWRFDPGGSGGLTSQIWGSEKAFDEEAQTAKGIRKSAGGKTVRRLSQGLRMAMTADRMCAFWDLHKPEERVEGEHSVAEGYTSMLEEGSGVDIESFLEDHTSLRRRERFRLGLCKEVEVRMVNTVGRCVAREMARRLRDRVAAHKYIVMPFGGSIHAVIRPPAQDAAPTTRSSVVGGAKLLPHVDVSMEIQMMSMAPDVRQVQSMAWLADYIKRWFQEERRFQWRPPPTGLGHQRSSLASARWYYALHRILHCVDPSHNWHSIGWIGMQRRIDCRAAYYIALTGVPPLDQENIAVLQVALPLADALSIRKEAAFFNALRQKMRQSSAVTDMCSSFKSKLPWGSKKRDPRTSLSDLEMGEATVSTASSATAASARVSVSVPEKGNEDGGNKLANRASEMAVQVHVSVGTAKMGILSPEAYVHAPRRPIMLGQASELEVIAAYNAPRKVWMRLAPPEAITETLSSKEGQPPQGIVFEFSLASVRAVFYAAPSSAWQLRRCFFCGGGSLGPRGGRPGDDHQTFAPGATSEEARVSFAKGGVCIEKALLEARIQIRVADMGVLEGHHDWHVTPKSTWVFGACVPPMEVHVLKPLIQALLRTVKPPKPPMVAMAAVESAASAEAHKAAASGRRSSLNSSAMSSTASMSSWLGDGSRGKNNLITASNFMSGGSSSSSPPRVAAEASLGARSCVARAEQMKVRPDPAFWGHLLELQRMRATRASAERKHRLSEKLMGASGFMKGGLIRGSILFLGGMRADVLAPHTGEQWILQAVHMPAGTVTVSRGGLNPDLQAGFRPLSSAPGTAGGLTQAGTTGGITKATDRWWFATELEAKILSDRMNPDRFGKKKSLSSDGWKGEPEANDNSCVGEDAAEDPPEAVLSAHGDLKPVQISAWQKAMVRTLRYKPRDSEKGLLQTSSPHSPRTPRKSLVKPSSANSPFCCHDVSMAACAKSISARKQTTPSSAHSERIRPPPSLPSPQATPVSAVSPQVVKPSMRSCSPPPTAPSFGEIDVWLETLLAKDVGLPSPRLAEDLWASMGCARMIDHSVSPMFPHK